MLRASFVVLLVLSALLAPSAGYTDEPTAPLDEGTPPCAKVTVTTASPGAILSLDGATLKVVTPYTFQCLPPGAHTIEATQGATIGSVSVDVVPGDALDLTITMAPPPAPAASPCVTIELESKPSGADIMLNGMLTGQTTPHTFACLAPGAYTFAVSEGSSFGTKKVRVKQGETLALTVELDREASGGLLVESSPPGSTVTIDGAKMGTTPLELDDLPVGPVKLEVAHDDHIGKTTTAMVVPERRKTVLVMLESLPDLTVGPDLSFGDGIAFAAVNLSFREYEWLWGSVSWGLTYDWQTTEPHDMSELATLAKYDTLERIIMGSSLVLWQRLDIPLVSSQGIPILGATIGVGGGVTLGGVNYFYSSTEWGEGQSSSESDLANMTDTPSHTYFNWQAALRVGVTIWYVTLSYTMFITPMSTVETIVPTCEVVPWGSSTSSSGPSNTGTVCSYPDDAPRAEWTFPTLLHMGTLTLHVPLD